MPIYLQAVFDSNRVVNCTMFEVNLDSNTTECITIPQNIMDDSVPSPLPVPSAKLNTNLPTRKFEFHPNGYT